MESSDPRNTILEKIRTALANKSEQNNVTEADTKQKIYKTTEENSEVIFAKAFTGISGKFVFCIDEKELIITLRKLFHDSQWDSLYCLDKDIQRILVSADIPFSDGREEFLNLDAGITGCEYLIARPGSVMVSSRQSSGRRLIVYPNTHIVIAYTSFVVNDLDEALQKITKKYKGNLPSMISLITGPSRTADIEKTLVMGAHGPKNLYVFLVNDKKL